MITTLKRPKMIPCIFKDRDPHKPYVIGRHIQYLSHLSSPKLTKCFLLNGGNLNDDMTPGFKQFTVNILVMKIISLHSDAKTAVDWVQLSFGNKRPFRGFAKNQLENNRQTLYQSHYIC